MVTADTRCTDDREKRTVPLLIRELLYSHGLVVTGLAHRTHEIQHTMNLCDYDGRPLVGDLSDPLLERLRAVHGEPRRDHHNGRREPAEDPTENARVCARNCVRQPRQSRHLAIGRAGTLSGGARRLGVDHSTAFRRLGALESRLGVRLFDRARDGYVPTLGGEAVIAEATRFDEAVAGLERQLAGADLRPSGVVRVTGPDTLIDIFAPLVARFRAEYPEITIELAVANKFFALTHRDADVAVRPAAQVPDNLVGRRISEGNNSEGARTLPVAGYGL